MNVHRQPHSKDIQWSNFHSLCLQLFTSAVLWYLRLRTNFYRYDPSGNQVKSGCRCWHKNQKSEIGPRFLLIYGHGTFSALMPLVGWQEGHPDCKNWVVGCWHGYLCGAKCRFEYGPLMPLPLTVSCSRKSRLVLVLPFWCQLTRVVSDKIHWAAKWL